MPFKNLIDGYLSFHEDYFKSSDETYEKLVSEGQSPQTLVIACSDSRTDPAMLTKCAPGDLFVVRNVAAIVPPYQPDDEHHGTSAAIEFAVRDLKVENIIVMGHSLCGGINALLHHKEIKGQYEFISQWMDIGKPALTAVEETLSGVDDDMKKRALEQAVVLVSLNNLRTFPFINDAIKKGNIELHGWYFDIRNGNLMSYDTDIGQFKNIQKEL